MHLAECFLNSLRIEHQIVAAAPAPYDIDPAKNACRNERSEVWNPAKARLLRLV